VQDSERHGMSALLKYPPDFKHFDYVNPNAPKGGIFSHVGATRAFNQNFLTFNSLNSFILKGGGAQGMETRARWLPALVPHRKREPKTCAAIAHVVRRVQAMSCRDFLPSLYVG
jgi:hypothetical protein